MGSLRKLSLVSKGILLNKGWSMTSNEWDVRDEVEWWDDALGEDGDLDGGLFSFILTKISSKP